MNYFNIGVKCVLLAAVLAMAMGDCGNCVSTLADQQCEPVKVSFETLREYRDKVTGCWTFIGNFIQFAPDTTIVFQTPIAMKIATVYSVADGAYLTSTQMVGSNDTISVLEYAMINTNTVPKRTCLLQTVEGFTFLTQASTLSRYQVLEFTDAQTGYAAGYQLLNTIPNSQGAESIEFKLSYPAAQGGGIKFEIEALSGPRQAASVCADIIPNYSESAFTDRTPNYQLDTTSTSARQVAHPFTGEQALPKISL